MEQKTLFKVRDLRQKTQFKIDDAYLNGYARFCGRDASLVYMSLSRHAEFNTQKAFPSQELMAYQHSISVKAVRRGIKKLIEYNIIIVEKERKVGKFMNYVYTLLDKSEWKQLAIGQKRPMVKQIEPQDDSAIRRKTTMVKVPTKDNKVFKDNKVINKDNKKNSNLKNCPKNSNNKLSMIVDYFLELKEIRPEAVNYTRHLRPARDLLVLCDGDVEKAKDALDKAKDWVEGFGGEEWVIETAIKKFIESK